MTKLFAIFALLLGSQFASAAVKPDLQCDEVNSRTAKYRLVMNYDGMSGTNVYKLKGALLEKRAGRFVVVSEMKCESGQGVAYACENTLGNDAGYRAGIDWTEGGTVLVARVFENVDPVTTLACIWHPDR